MASRAWSSAALVVSLATLLAVFVLDRAAPFPAADVARGSEDAFAAGLDPRELAGPPGARTPLRWTGARAYVGFRNLPPGARTLEVALSQHRQPIAVAVDGAIVGSLPAGVNAAAFALPASPRSSLSVELRTETFTAGGGRQLGAHFDRVALRHARAAVPAPGLLVGAAAVALGVLGAAALAGVAPLVAAALALLSLAGYAALLLPMGLLRSGYAVTLPLMIVIGTALALGFARRRGTPWAFVALLGAWLVQAVAMTSPLVVTSDAVMHANKLMQVAGGDLFPLSRTLHVPPFQFPYGVSFYALLAPLLRLGLEPVALVRYAAGVFGALAAVPLFLMGERAPARAALAVLLLQTMPITCNELSYGNLSNVFAQALTLAALCWWLMPRGGAVAGALLLLAAALAHLSSLIVLAVSIPLLFVIGARDRRRVTAVVVAAGLAALYYAHFLPLILEQLPRLGAGAEAGGRSLGFFQALGRQTREALGQWGIPATLLTLFGMPRASEGEPSRLLTAVWTMGALLAFVACVSPVEVRYLYAMSFAVALAAAGGVTWLWGRRGLGRMAAVGLLGWQLAAALVLMREIVLSRYRLQ